MQSSDLIYRKNPDIVFRKIAQEYILVPIKSRVSDLKSIFTLNELGARIWELIDKKNKVSEIKDVLLREFEVNTQELEKDLTVFLQQLINAELIKEV